MKARPPIVAFRARDSAGGSLRAYRRESRPWPHHAADMHGHRFYVLNFYDRGEGEVRLPKASIPVAAGHVFLAPPGELHDTAGIARMGGWVVEFTGDLVPQSAALVLPGKRAGAAAFAVVPQAARASWTARLEKLVIEAESARLGSLEAARSLLQLILIDLARLLSPQTQQAAAGGAPLSREVLTLINRRYGEPGLSLSQVARAVGRSPGHVTAVLREQTGMTVLEWITERRMEEARRRLRETDEDVSIVAERVGYEDPAYFARVFRRIHGMPARAFRNAR
jgi:AraC family transcriptional activator of pobA